MKRVVLIVETLAYLEHIYSQEVINIYADFTRLVLPVVLSLIATIIVSKIFIKNNTKKKTLLIASVINCLILSLGTLWFWIAVPDGLAQLMQAGIYGVCFIIIFVFNLIVIMVLGRKKPNPKLSNI